MNDAQIWTVIGLLAAVAATLVTMTLRIVKVEIASLGYRLGGRIDSMESRFDAKIDTAESRLQAKLDVLDRDVHTLFQRFTERDA